jgi:hypothetical protein
VTARTSARGTEEFGIPVSKLLGTAQSSAVHSERAFAGGVFSMKVSIKKK